MSDIKNYLYKYCPTCFGTGKRPMRNPDGTPTEIDCDNCDSTGLILYGEIRDDKIGD